MECTGSRGEPTHSQSCNKRNKLASLEVSFGSKKFGPKYFIDWAISKGKHYDGNDGAHRESPVEHLVLEDVGEGGGVPGEEVGVPRGGELP